MAKLRKFCAYRRVERAYTRFSKYRQKSFIRVKPASKVVTYEMGAPNKKFSYNLELLAKKEVQIRHNAIESARQTSNRVLEQNLGKTGYHMKVRIYPHHILRENPLAAGAGADRMSTGMKMSFGKAIGSAARVMKDQIIVQVRVNSTSLELAKSAMKRFSHKMPVGCRLDIQKVVEKVKKE